MAAMTTHFQRQQVRGLCLLIMIAAYVVSHLFDIADSSKAAVMPVPAATDGDARGASLFEVSRRKAG